jgi:tRNA(fMet)-specific endonuclease VapC
MNGKCLVDTNVIIRLLRSDERSVALFDNADEIFIPAIVAGELFYGAQNSARKQENLNIFNDFISQYEIAEVNADVANVYGEIKAQLKRDGINIPENDLWIAAVAKHNNFTLLTFDAHFSRIAGLRVLS